MKSIGSLAVGAGFFFVTLAMFVQGFLPAMIPESRSRSDCRTILHIRRDTRALTERGAVC